MIQPTALLPFVPSGPDFVRSRALFHELGFEELWENGGYAGFGAGAARFILQQLDEPAFAGQLMIKIEVQNLEAWWSEINAKDLTARFPGARVRAPTEFPWGREVHLIDLAGVCWHIGEA